MKVCTADHDLWFRDSQAWERQIHIKFQIKGKK